MVSCTALEMILDVMLHISIISSFLSLSFTHLSGKAVVVTVHKVPLWSLKCLDDSNEVRAEEKT
jgi:hypothetical protein